MSEHVRVRFVLAVTLGSWLTSSVLATERVWPSKHEEGDRLGAILFSTLGASQIDCPAYLDPFTRLHSVVMCGRVEKLRKSDSDASRNLVDTILAPFTSPESDWKGRKHIHRRSFSYEDLRVELTMNTKWGTVRFEYWVQGVRCPAPPKGDPDPGLTDPVPVQTSSLRYPVTAWFQRLQGTVRLRATVLADGSVGDVCVIEASVEGVGFEPVAIDAIRTWKYAPGRLDGEPVDVSIQIVASFTLE